MRYLIIVDMQNDFINGPLGSLRAKEIVPKITQKLYEYQKEDTLVMFTKDVHYENYSDTLEAKFYPFVHCLEGTEGQSLNKEISHIVDTGSFYTYHSTNVIKSRFIKSTYGSSQLFDVFRHWNECNQITPNDTIEVIGVCTNICVLANVVLLRTACPEIPIKVDASCCAGTSMDAHNKALEMMEFMGVTITNRED